MIGAADRFPGVPIVVDVPAPSQCLKSYAHAALGRQFAELTQVRCRAINAAQAFRRYVGADHQEVAAQLLHQVELALGTLKDATAAVVRHAFEVAEGLKGDGLE